MTLATLSLLVALTLGPAPAQEPSVPVSVVQDIVDAPALMDLATIGPLVTLLTGSPAPSPSPAHVEPMPGGLTLALIAVDGGLSGADLATTWSGLGRGTGRETNPVLRGLSDHPVAYGLLKGAIDAAAITACAVLAGRNWTHGALCFGLHVGLKTWVVVHNARQLGRMP